MKRKNFEISFFFLAQSLSSSPYFYKVKKMKRKEREGEKRERDEKMRESENLK